MIILLISFYIFCLSIFCLLTKDLKIYIRDYYYCWLYQFLIVLIHIYVLYLVHKSSMRNISLLRRVVFIKMPKAHKSQENQCLTIIKLTL